MLTTILPLVLASVSGEADNPPSATLALQPMVVVSTRSPRPLADVAGVVTVIDGGRMRDDAVVDVEDLMRYEVGISAETAGTRFGFDGFNIRGIGGNRVAIEVDGVPMNDHFDIGNFASAGRGLVDTEFIRRVEILRGPASTLYGSDAIGGVTAFFTWQPRDLLAERESGLRLRGGYDSADHGRFTSILAATEQGHWGLLAGAVRRRGAEPDHAVEAGGVKDALDTAGEAFLARLEHSSPAGNRFGLIASHDDQQRDSSNQSLLGQGRFRDTTLLRGDDEQTRSRLSLEYTFNTKAVDQGALRVFHTRSDTDQFTLEERAARNQRIRRRFLYQQDALGIETEYFHSFDSHGASHRLGVGFEVSRTDVQERREGLQTDLDDAHPSQSLLGEVFPVRDFPNSEIFESGLWVQDEIRWQRLSLIPALRFEDYRLRPRADRLFRDDNPATEVVDVDQSELTPRLGLLYHMDAGWSLFGQYARGFRAPPFGDANIGLDIPRFNIRAIPNPDLRSENSDTVEVGLRRLTPGQRLELVAFYSRYDDFIESRVRLGADPATGVVLFQSRNLDRTSIRGLELRYQQRLPWYENIHLRLSGFHASGEDETSGAELASLGPDEALAGLAWQHPDHRWRVELIGRAVAAKRRLATMPQQFLPDGYEVFDLLSQWTPAPDLHISLGLFNLTDERYWRWQDVRGLDSDDPALPLLSRPGRYFNANLEWRY